MNNKKYKLGDEIKEVNIKTLNYLRNINPAYAEHMYEKNRIVEAFAMSELGGVDLLEQPICPHCEKPGAWHCDFKPLDPKPNEDCIECQEMQAKLKELAGMLIEKDGELTADDYPHIGCCWCDVHGKTTFAITLKQYLSQELKVDNKNMEIIERINYGGDKID